MIIEYRKRRKNREEGEMERKKEREERREGRVKEGQKNKEKKERTKEGKSTLIETAHTEQSYLNIESQKNFSGQNVL